MLGKSGRVSQTHLPVGDGNTGSRIRAARRARLGDHLINTVAASTTMHNNTGAEVIHSARASPAPSAAAANTIAAVHQPIWRPVNRMISAPAPSTMAAANAACGAPSGPGTASAAVTAAAAAPSSPSASANNNSAANSSASS